MPRKDLVQFVIAPQHEPGLEGISLKMLQPVPSMPTPMSEFLTQAFAELQLKCGLSLAESRAHPYERAQLAEQILDALEKYYIDNAVRSEALSNFISMRLLMLLGLNKVLGECTWKKITIAAYWKEDEEARGDEIRIEVVPQPQQKIKPIAHVSDQKEKAEDEETVDSQPPEAEVVIGGKEVGHDTLDICLGCGGKFLPSDLLDNRCADCRDKLYRLREESARPDAEQGDSACCIQCANQYKREHLSEGYCPGCKGQLDAGETLDDTPEIITVQSDDQ